MPNITRLPGTAPDLALPLPAGAGMGTVLNIAIDLEAAVTRSERVVQELQTHLEARAAGLPEGFDPDAVADDWHAELAEPLLVEHPVLRDEYAQALAVFHEGCALVSGVLSDWALVCEQLSHIAERHTALVDRLQRITGEIAETEWRRRSPPHGDT